MKKHSKSFWIKLISGSALGVAAMVTTLSVMLPSYLEYKNYYNIAMADKAEKERLSKLPLEFLGISAELDQNVKYWDNDTAEPQNSDFIVRANFTEKGKDFSKRLSSKEFEMTVPSDFAKNGGTIVFSYTYTPEKNSDDEKDPEPITKTTELTLTLVTPDETVFKLMKEPTFTEAGYAENIKGSRKELEPLDMVHYDYVEKASSGLGIFTHKDSSIVVKVAITDSLSVYNESGQKFDYNNINCHFAQDFENLAIVYTNGTFVFSNEGETVLNLGSIEGEKTAIEFKTGEFSLKGQLKTKKVLIKSAAKINLSGYIRCDDIRTEKDSELVAEWTGGNCLILGENGYAELYGKATFNGQNSGTAVELIGGAKLLLSLDSRIVITNCDWSFGTFSANSDGLKEGYLFFPKGYSSKDGSIYVGEVCVLDLSGMTQKWFCNIKADEATEYEVTKAPGIDNPGTARRLDGSEITLPALNFSDYATSINGKILFFKHNDTGIRAEVSLENANNLKVDGLTVNYDAETGYVFTVDKDREINISGTLSTSNFDSMTIAGEGLLSIAGEVAVDPGKSLTVNSGSALKVTGTTGDAINVFEDGKLNLFGKVDVISADGKTGINLHSEQSAIYLQNTSRVTATGGACTIAHWDNDMHAKVYYPSDAVYNESEKKIVSQDGNTLLSYDSSLKVDFVPNN